MHLVSWQTALYLHGVDIAMGFTPEEVVYRLKFVDPAMRGLIVEAREAPLGTILDVMQIGTDPGKMTSEQLKAVYNLFSTFVDSIVSWNLEDKNGTPVAISLDGLRSYGFRFAMDLAVVWSNAGVEVSAPLEKRSTNGSPSVAASIPMETSSASLPN